MNAESIRDLLEHEIQDLYSAEAQILDALPTIIEYTSDAELRKALKQHLAVTEDHRSRLEQAASELAMDVEGKKCKGMAGILKEGSDAVEEVDDEAVRDAVIIASAQKVEHYEIAGYGTALSFATLLGEDAVADLLSQTLDEEKEADETLSDIAETSVNPQAVGG